MIENENGQSLFELRTLAVCSERSKLSLCYVKRTQDVTLTEILSASPVQALCKFLSFYTKNDSTPGQDVESFFVVIHAGKVHKFKVSTVIRQKKIRAKIIEEVLLQGQESHHYDLYAH